MFVDEWPTQGKIDIIGLSVKYREELDFALKNLSLSIPARAKVHGRFLRAARAVNMRTLCFDVVRSIMLSTSVSLSN